MKEVYRKYLLRVMPYVKLSYFLPELGIQKQNLSHFLKGKDSYMSTENLEKLVKAIQEKIRCDL